MFRVKKSDPPATRTVPIEGQEGCSLTVREPTFYERVEQWWKSRAADKTIDQSKLWDYRLRVVCGWEGFEDPDGKPLAFSLEWLRRAMQQDEAVMLAAIDSTNAAFVGLEANDEKNSVAPQEIGSLAAEVNAETGA